MDERKASAWAFYWGLVGAVALMLVMDLAHAETHPAIYKYWAVGPITVGGVFMPGDVGEVGNVGKAAAVQDAIGRSIQPLGDCPYPPEGQGNIIANPIFPHPTQGANFYQYEGRNACTGAIVPGWTAATSQVNGATGAWSCPSGGTLTWNGTNYYNCVGATACVAPQVRNASTGICEDPPAPPCVADEEHAVAAIVGYDTAPNPAPGSPLALVVPVPTTMCSSGCRVAITGSVDPDGGTTPIGGGNAAGICQTMSSTTSTGYYPVYCFLNGATTGAECTAEDESPADNLTTALASAPACQGSLGTVNGKTVCLPVAGTTNPSTPSAPIVDDNGVERPPTSAEDVHTADPDGGGRSGGAAPVPTSGTLAPGDGAPGGASRGVNTGAQSGALNNTQNSAAGVTGGGGANVDLSVETCGLPGTPACKIDETGTPTGANEVTSALAQLASFQSDTAAQIGALGGAEQVTDLGWTWTGMTLPTVECVPWEFTFNSWTGTVEWCSWFGVVRELFGWFLSVLAALFVWRSFVESMAHGGFN